MKKRGTKSKRITASYSGRRSRAFWDVVDALPEREHGKLYTAGVLLQNMEATILCWLNNEAPRRIRVGRRRGRGS